jgi:hypothetical protein
MTTAAEARRRLLSAARDARRADKALRDAQARIVEMTVEIHEAERRVR